jgi:hypothetical protein
LGRLGVVAASVSPADRAAFLERVRLQLQARYRELSVAPDVGRWGLRLSGSGVDVRLALTPLHQAVLREPGRAAALIADFVRSVEAQLTPARPLEVSLARTLWCVRTAAYVAEHTRGSDLLVRPLAGQLVAFVAEQLPNSIMRGVPREAWAPPGEAEVSATADRNTARHFAPYGARIRAATRVPRDGWQFSGDPLFEGSMMVVPEVLAALTDRAGGEVLMATPDRGMVLVVPVDGPGAAEFPRRVVRAWRAAMNPCSTQVVRSDGVSVTAVPSRTEERAAGLLRRLRG